VGGGDRRVATLIGGGLGSVVAADGRHSMALTLAYLPVLGTHHRQVATTAVYARLTLDRRIQGAR
jgi:hypothetical protein